MVGVPVRVGNFRDSLLKSLLVFYPKLGCKLPVSLVAFQVKANCLFLNALLYVVNLHSDIKPPSGFQRVSLVGLFYLVYLWGYIIRAGGYLFLRVVLIQRLLYAQGNRSAKTVTVFLMLATRFRSRLMQRVSSAVSLHWPKTSP